MATTRSTGWLWVLVTLISYFQVWLSRSQAVAQSLLGYDFKGILTGDRYGAYNWLEVASRKSAGHISSEILSKSQNEQEHRLNSALLC